MLSKFSLVLFAALAVNLTFFENTHAESKKISKILNDGGVIDAIDGKHESITIDDRVLLLAPSIRVINSLGQPSSLHSLHRGTVVNYSAIQEGNTASKPRVTEIVILPSGKPPARGDD